MPSSDYTLLKSPYPDQALVHVHPDAGELGRVYRPTVAINASAGGFRRSLRPAQAGDGAGAGRQRRRSCMQPISTGRRRPRAGPGPVQMGPIMDWLETVLPEDAILCNGVR